jgi:hypothetical protein
MAIANYAFNKFMRTSMYAPEDLEGFWIYLVKKDVYDTWEISAYRGIRYWVSELEANDLRADPNLLSQQAMFYCMTEIGIYGIERQVKFLKDFARDEYFSCQERYELFVHNNDMADDRDAEINAWKIAYNAMPVTTDKEKAAKEAEKLNKPREVVRYKDPRDVPTWGGIKTYGTHFPYEHDLRAFVKRTFVENRKFTTFFPKDGHRLSRDDYDSLQKEYRKYFLGTTMADKKSGPKGIGITQRLSKESEEWMEMIRRNERGKAIEPKIKNWLMTSLAGSKMQELAAQAIHNSLINQDFWDSEE